VRDIFEGPTRRFGRIEGLFGLGDFVAFDVEVGVEEPQDGGDGLVEARDGAVGGGSAVMSGVAASASWPRAVVTKAPSMAGFQAG
jgi:hypothetical protein